MTEPRAQCFQCRSWVLKKHIHKEIFVMGVEREVELCTACWLIMKRADESLESKELEVEVYNETQSADSADPQEPRT